MDRKELVEKYPEAKSIVNYILSRYRKGLLNVTKFIGLSGTGKSYASLRLAELLSIAITGKNNITINNVVDNLLDLIRFIKSVDKHGVVVIMEEAEVLFPARRAMSGDNVDAIKIFDTIRKKKMIVILNYPLNKSIDGHLESLCNLQIETMSLNKTSGICIIKPIILQTNPASGKTYFHRLCDEGNEIHRSYLLKPSDALCFDYELKKDKFIDELHQMLEDKQTKKNNKQIGKYNRELTTKQMDAFNLVKIKGLTYKEAGKVLGVSHNSIKERIELVLKKMKKAVAPSFKTALN